MKKIYLSKYGKARNKKLYTLVDDENFDELNKYNWSLTYGSGGRYYAIRLNYINKKRDKWILLHRFLLNAPRNKEVDHINGNGLDNRKINIRLCTSAQNSWNTKKHKDNTSGHKGVSWDKFRSKWIAQMNFLGEHIFLGRFENKADAVLKYNEKVKEFRGEFAFQLTPQTR